MIFLCTDNYRTRASPRGTALPEFSNVSYAIGSSFLLTALAETLKQDFKNKKMTTSRRKPSPMTPNTLPTADGQNNFSKNGGSHQSSRPSAAEASKSNGISHSAFGTSSQGNGNSTSSTSLLFPTTIESAFLSIFPLTIFLGTLFSHIAPQVRSSNYDTSSYSSSSSSSSPLFSSSSSSTEAVAVYPPSYFAQKRNIFNLYFVKIGWFWTTMALAAFGGAHPYFSGSEKQVFLDKKETEIMDRTASEKAAGERRGAIGQRRRLRLAIRYIIATTWWIAVTQWFFGPPLIDRSFRWSGGVCETRVSQEAVDTVGGTPAGFSPVGSQDGSLAGISQRVDVFTAAECKAAGGQWQGGHDVSGHVFMLCLSCAVIALEVLPVLFTARWQQKQRSAGDVASETSASSSSKAVDASTASPASQGFLSSTPSSPARLATRFALVVAVLSWWMLLMTAVFFHTWLEKLTGLVIALAAIWSVYVMPRALWQVVVGVPEP